ncbi:hypothetical protein CcCBS67573_g02968 [Chytriomyces confervae]|uniref:Protein-S-isoprenylcysteine O-methyltransferase n=1 Tax=Chytriomyces confervae TaxID=246404 RepID=A0A507FH63_9FUNG|nr:hypothetical protein HDU80_003065 [Chytriomyces hyalinus]TPX75751.1 hypothetical protein CcCBS67573_g02968 [Chytriomyces confervae]
MAQYARAAYLGLDALLVASVMVDRSLILKAIKGAESRTPEKRPENPAEGSTSKSKGDKKKKNGSPGETDDEKALKTEVLATTSTVKPHESIMISLYAGNLWIQILSALGILSLTALQMYDVAISRPHLFNAPITASQQRAAVLSILMSLLRLWAISTLGPLFTFTVHAPTKLVTTGPYEMLIHPSYTGILGWNLFKFSFLVDGTGPFVNIALRVWDALDLHNIAHSRLNILDVFTDGMDVMWFLSILGLGAGLMVLPIAIYRRMMFEEWQLEQTFGVGAFREYRAKRWRLIPFLL